MRRCGGGAEAGAHRVDQGPDGLGKSSRQVAPGQEVLSGPVPDHAARHDGDGIAVDRRRLQVESNSADSFLLPGASQHAYARHEP